MIRSMTGYGIGTVETEKFKVSIEIRSVNHRFFDLRVKLPQQLTPLEPQIKKTVQSKVSRGKIDVSITINGINEMEYEIKMNRPFIAGYIEAFHQIKNEFGLQGDLTAQGLLQLPGAMDFKVKEKIYQNEEIDAITEALQKALASLEEMRIKEGALIGEDILSRLGTMEEKRKGIAQICGSLPDVHKKNLMARIRELEPDIKLDPSRLEQEVAFMVDKCDISEEVSRLKGHFEHLETLLQNVDEVGKKLDFLMQEINREANTINSKVGNLDINRAVIDIKLEAEKIREQAQNIE
ncbi:MAG: YicC/YloC family endoribonuclease [Acidobacteriota bacterium]